jgi:condensin complex subunit 3
MQLPDDAKVSDEIWDEVIEGMKVRVQDKIHAIRVFAVRAVSRFAIDEDDGGIIDIFLEALEKEQNAVSQINPVPPNTNYRFPSASDRRIVSFEKEVRKMIVLSLPASNATLEAIIESTMDVNESVRRAAYSVLSTKFPLQSLR